MRIISLVLFGALGNVAMALNAAETTKVAAKRLKCVTGALMIKQIRKVFSPDQVTVCEKVRQDLQKLDPKMDLCYRHDWEDFVVLNSKDVGCDVLDKIVPRAADNMYLTIKTFEQEGLFKYPPPRLTSLPSGEKVLYFLPRIGGPDLSKGIWLKGGYSF